MRTEYHLDHAVQLMPLAVGVAAAAYESLPASQAVEEQVGQESHTCQ